MIDKTPSMQAVLSDLARVKVAFQLLTIRTIMGPDPRRPQPQEEAARG